ncbi:MULTISPECIES: deoxyribose-phosphate aldolase [Anaeromyxobacter]|uniref:deoxyribose-phosphate aldolase n=1 Tax=Anaeromyxobacter TaxID=161492 RepID=UPI001F59F097|nr:MULTISPECIES: deoxyribose-phosphate aldolase [unclassified Anaeromyxobacter]
MRTVDPATIRTPRDLAPYLDHTLLAPGATEVDVARVCAEARAYGFAGVCVHAAHIPQVRLLLADTAVQPIAVADFPRGEGTPAARAAEAAAAAAAGAEEIDVVLPLPAVLAGRYEAALEDLRGVVAAARVPVKVILETSKLTRDQRVVAAALARCAGASYVKTSTGFGGGGATVEDVALLRAVVGGALGVKASGGVRSAAQALAMIRAGASRVGASACVDIVLGTF